MGFVVVVLLMVLIVEVKLVVGEGGFAWWWGSLAQTCTAVCSATGSTCDASKLKRLDSDADTWTALKGTHSCDFIMPAADPAISAPNDYTYVPAASGPYCFWDAHDRGTCDGSRYNMYRICPCTCLAGTYAVSNLQPAPCSR